MSTGSRRTRRRLWAAALATLVVLAAGAVFLLQQRPGDVVNEGVEFSERDGPTTTPREPTPAGKRHDPDFEWPLYGYTKDRAKTFAMKDPSALHPPYEQRWAARGRILLEFPPVLGRRSAYILKNNGALHAISRRTGRIRWKRKLGYLAAASPAYAHNTVYSVLLNRFKGSPGGRITAVGARGGRTRWSRKLPSRSESSPLIDRGRVFFGSENGRVYCLDASDGRIVWTYRAEGAVKGALAMDDDRNLYFGDYAGKVHSIRARDGSRRWTSGTSGGRLGLSAGNFYATPAVAFGRVYIGNTDGGVYAFGTKTGRLAWRKTTGAFVYSSPAAAKLPGGRPTVYVGSYDRKLYALDARTGRARWTRNAGGRISGGIAVIGDLVFYSTLEKTTAAVGARTGRKVWRTRRGAFNPVVSDGRRIYLVGYSSLFALTPKRLLAEDRPRRGRERRSRARRDGASRQRR